MLTYILIYIGLNLITGMKEGIDAAAHLGGLISGFAIGYAFYYGLINKESKELNYWILGVVSFLGISGSYLTLEKIPNPIKNYRSNDGRKLNYFDVYDVKMKDFEGNEMLALEIKNKSDYNREEILHYIDNHTLYYWKKNLKIVNEIEKFSLPEEVLKKNEILKKYVLLRIQQTQLIKQKIETKSDKFNKKLIETNQEIENIIDVLVNL
jgi:rhomboid protease GluP